MQNFREKISFGIIQGYIYKRPYTRNDGHRLSKTLTIFSEHPVQVNIADISNTGGNPRDTCKRNRTSANDCTTRRTTSPTVSLNCRLEESHHYKRSFATGTGDLSLIVVFAMSPTLEKIVLIAMTLTTSRPCEPVHSYRAKRYARRRRSSVAMMSVSRSNDPRVRRPLESFLHTPSDSIHVL